jgi:hypothetical protein
MFRFAYVLLVAGAAAQGVPKNGNVALVNDPAGCASDLAGAVAAITAASSHIVQGVAACPPQTDDKDKLCAAAITLSITQFSLASEKLSSASRTCANTLATDKGAKCGEDISDTIKQFGVTSAFLISSTESCKPPEEGGSAFGCVVDVVDVVDALANAAEGINDAVISCQSLNKLDAKMVYLYQTWLETGCPSLPTPDWIQWGYWYADSNNKSVVLKSMYDMCMTAKAGSDPHTANMCCASTSCTGAPCTLQSSFTGVYVPPTATNKTTIRSDSQLQESWPLTLE